MHEGAPVKGPRPGRQYKREIGEVKAKLFSEKLQDKSKYIYDRTARGVRVRFEHIHA